MNSIATLLFYILIAGLYDKNFILFMYRIEREYLVTLYNKVSLLTLVDVLTNMNKQWTKHLLHYLLIFVNVS